MSATSPTTLAVVVIIPGLLGRKAIVDLKTERVYLADQGSPEANERFAAESVHLVRRRLERAAGAPR